MGKADDFSVFVDQPPVEPFHRRPTFLEVGGEAVERIVFTRRIDRKWRTFEASAQQVCADPAVEQRMVIAVLV